MAVRIEGDGEIVEVESEADGRISAKPRPSRLFYLDRSSISPAIPNCLRVLLILAILLERHSLINIIYSAA